MNEKTEKSPRRTVKLKAETLRALETPDAGQKQAITTAGYPCTYLCTYGTTCKTPGCPQ